MTTSERLGHFLVALPIAHVLGASLFLWGYCAGFGANLSTHVSVTDLLTVSISDMVWGYASTLVLPGLMAAWLSQQTPGFSRKFQGPPDYRPRFKGLLNNSRGILLLVTVLTLVASSAILVVWRYYLGLPLDYLLLTVLAIFVTPFGIWYWCVWIGLSVRASGVTVLLTFFVVSLTTSGLTEGQRDRFLPYRYSKVMFSSCQQAILFRRFGDLYLAALPDDTRALVDRDCRVRMRFPQPKGRGLPLAPILAASR